MKSRVHPKYETKYRVANWAEYERGLIQRGDVTIWLSPESVAAWKPTREAITLLVDGTGLSIVGEAEWVAAKHGGKGKRGWKRLHLGVDSCGVIVAQVLT